MSSLSDTTALELELDGSWLTVWFNEPESRNPLTRARVSELLYLCDELEDRRDIRGITFRGRGGVFCAGGDIKAFEDALAQGEGNSDEAIALSNDAAQLYDAINSLPQLTLMAVEGAAMGGGFGLVCTADVVLACDTARFCLSETMIGLSPAQICPFVLQRLGQREGRRLMLLAPVLTAQEAVELGLADTLCHGVDEMDDKITELRIQIGRCAPGAVAETKRLIRELPSLPRGKQVRVAAESFAARLNSAEGREGIGSFLEKRKPNWLER